MSRISRRQFLAAAIGGTAALAGVGLWVGHDRRRDAAGGRVRVDPQSGLARVTRTGHAFGTAISLTALHADATVANDAINAALAELNRIERVASLYRPDSQLSRLNATGRLDEPDPLLVEALRLSQDCSQRSGGAFDVTVQPLWQVHAEARAAGRLVALDDLERARDRVNWQALEVGDNRVRLARPGMGVTLNGIVQGLAADRALAAIRDRGVEHALVNTGEVGAIGAKPDGAWTAGIQHPRHADAFIRLTRLDGRQLSTSGDYATTFSDDFESHHIFDPATGGSPGLLASVSVLAERAADADALSTAVFVLGPQRGLQLLRSTPRADALLVFKTGQTLATDGFATSA